MVYLCDAIFINKKKHHIDTFKNEFQNYAKNANLKTHIEWFHTYELLQQAKLIYNGETNRTIGVPIAGLGVDWVGHEGTF